MKKIPNNIQSLLSASNQINNHQKAVEELVYNALDAGATSIAIRINIQENTIQIIDNGCGVCDSDFNSIGKKYMTSKLVDLSTLKSVPNKYGFRGQSLANIVHVSKIVKVTSRHEKSEETWMKIFEYGKEKHIQRCNTRPSKGTTVEVNGFLYNISIQKKSRDILNEVQNIKTYLEHLSLVHSNISLSLRDDSKNEIIFKMHRNRDMYQTLSTLYNIKKEDVQELQVEKNEYKVTAFLGKDLQTDRQVIFLNGKFVSNSSKLHKMVNNNLCRYLQIGNTKKTKAKNIFRDEESHTFQKKIPFYLIFIKCPYMDYDLSNSSLEFKDWNQVKKLLEKLIRFFNGDINLKEVNKVEMNKTANKAEGSDTREQVKKIIRKILGSHPKKLGNTCIMNKGIKGKQIKRKDKKLVHKSTSKLLSHNENYNENHPNSHHSNEINEEIAKAPVIDDNNSNTSNRINKRKYINKTKNTLKKSLKPNFTKSIRTRIGKTYNSEFNKVSNNKLLLTEGTDSKIEITKEQHAKNNNNTKKPYIHNDKILRKFEMATDSVKRRCQKLDKRTAEMLNLINRRKRDVYVNKNVQYSNISKNNRNVSIRKQIDEIIIHDCISRAPKAYMPNENCIRNDDRKKAFQSNYDLVQTILKSQQVDSYIRRRVIDEPNNPVAIFNQSQPRNTACKDQLADIESVHNSIKPVPTFQSHNYNAHGNGPNYQYSNHTYRSDLQMKTDDHRNFDKRPKTFITKQSRDNFLANYSNKHSISKNKKIKTGYSKQFKSTIKRLFDQTSKLNKMKDQILGDTGESKYTIEYTESSYNKKSNKDKNFRYDSDIKSWTQSFNYNYCSVYNNDCISINQNTYTFSNVKKNDKNINEQNWAKFCTYTIENTSGSTTNSINFNENQLNNRNYIFISKSLENNYNEQFLDPINVCETILHNQDILNEEFEQSFNNGQKISNQQNRKDTKENHLNNEEKLYSQEILEDVSNHFSLAENSVAVDTNHQDCFSFKNRLSFIPKGMSPIFENCQTKNACELNVTSQDYYENEMYNNFAKTVLDQADIFEPKIKEVNELTSKDINKVNVKINKDNASLKFDGQSLNGAKILGQIDEKFIAAIMKEEITEFLVFFDQHAVHERIRLENNLSDYFHGNQWTPINIDGMTLKMSKDDVLYLHNYKDKFSQLGLQWTVLSTDEVSITTIPEAILGKNARQVDKVMQSVKKLVMEEINIIKMQGGCVSLYPKSIMDLVFNEACRYAIKFGDKLSKSECVELLKMLSDCKTPYQCAHGRPVMAVIMDIKPKKNEYKVNLSKLMEWKGKQNYRNNVCL